MKKLSILMAFLSLFLTGCQLAQPYVEAAQQPRLIGVLLTSDHLDLTDWDSYLQDNLSDFTSGGVLNADTSNYEGRLYAEVVQETLYDEDGNTVTKEAFDFPDVDGMQFFVASIDDTQYVSGDPAIVDTHVALTSTDEGESISLTGSVWMAYTDQVITCYINPVYQEADGHIYAVSGNGITNSGEGSLLTTTLTDTQTTTGSQTQSDTTSIKISIGTKLPPAFYQLTEMDENNQLLRQTQFQPDQVPEEWNVSDKAAYLLLETHDQDGSVSRELYQNDTDVVQTLSCQENGFFKGMDTQLIWPE